MYNDITIKIIINIEFYIIKIIIKTLNKMNKLSNKIYISKRTKIIFTNKIQK